MKFLLLQIPNVPEIAQTVDALEFSDQLILVIILLIVIIFSLVAFLLYTNRSRDKADELDSTQLNNQYDLLKEAFSLFKESNDNFNNAIQLFKQDRVDIKKWLELHDSSSAQRAERLREFFEDESKEIKDLIDAIVKSLLELIKHYEDDNKNG